MKFKEGHSIEAFLEKKIINGNDVESIKAINMMVYTHEKYIEPLLIKKIQKEEHSTEYLFEVSDALITLSGEKNSGFLLEHSISHDYPAVLRKNLFLKLAEFCSEEMLHKSFDPGMSHETKKLIFQVLIKKQSQSLLQYFIFLIENQKHDKWESEILDCLCTVNMKENLPYIIQIVEGMSVANKKKAIKSILRSKSREYLYLLLDKLMKDNSSELASTFLKNLFYFPIDEKIKEEIRHKLGRNIEKQQYKMEETLVTV